MFEKLTARERKLAYAVSALLPAALLFVAIFWFIGKYSANSSQELSLVTRIEEEEDRKADALRAGQRRAYFDSISLPADLDTASNEYQIWLKRLVKDELKMRLKSLTPRDTSDLKFKTKVVGKRSTYDISATGDIDQLTQFLIKFYSVDLLHRINTIRITPQNETSGSDKKVRTSVLSLSVKIEVLALKSSESNPGFMQNFRQLARTNEEYQRAILRRNIFSPANNSPIVSVRPSSSYTSGSDATIRVSVKDADKGDKFTYEILEAAGIEGVTLKPTKPGGSSAKLVIPGQAADKYAFKLKVVDDGFPPKESIAEFSVTFKDRVVPPKKELKPKVAFVNAKETQITGIVREVSGQWKVFIKVRTTGQRYQLGVGEAFDLDDQQWTVDSIKQGQVVMRVDSRLLTFYPKDKFVNPRNEVVLDDPEKTTGPTSIPGASDNPDTDSNDAPKAKRPILD